MKQLCVAALFGSFLLASISVAQVGSHPMHISGGVMAAQVESRTDPVYPPEAQAQHISGAVVLHVFIGKAGTVEDLSVVSGPEVLRSAAMEAVRTWKYRPYLLNGQSTAVDTTVTVNFQPGA